MSETETSKPSGPQKTAQKNSRSSTSSRSQTTKPSRKKTKTKTTLSKATSQKKAASSSSPPFMPSCSVLFNSLSNLAVFHTRKQNCIGIFFSTPQKEIPAALKKIGDFLDARVKGQVPVQWFPETASARPPFGPYVSVLPLDEDGRQEMLTYVSEAFHVMDEDETGSEPEDPDSFRWDPLPLTERQTSGKSKYRSPTQVWAALRPRLQPAVFNLAANPAQQSLETALLTAGEEKTPDRLVLFWKMGAGKTLGALRYARLVKARSVLVIASKTLIGQWVDVLRSHLDSALPSTWWVLISYERFSSLSNMPSRSYQFPVEDFDLVVVDEAHYFKNMNYTQQSSLEILQSFDKAMFLTGTPLRNDEGDLAFWVSALGGPDLRTVVTKQVPLPAVCRRFSAGPDFSQLVRKHIHCYDPVQSLPPDQLHRNYPLVRRETVRTPITLLQNLQYTIATSGLQTRVTNLHTGLQHPFQCQGPQRQWQRGVPLTGLYVSSSPSGSAAERPFVSAKVQKIKAIILATPPRKAGQRKSVILYSRFMHFFEDICKELEADGSGLRVRTLCGETSIQERTETITQFNQAQLDVIMLCRVGGEGVDLHGATSIHIFEPQLNQAETEQAVGRAVRFHADLGPKEPVRQVSVFEHVAVLPKRLQDFQIPDREAEPAAWESEETRTNAFLQHLAPELIKIMTDKPKPLAEKKSVPAASYTEGGRQKRNRRSSSSSQPQNRSSKIYPVVPLGEVIRFVLQANELDRSVEELMHINNQQKAQECKSIVSKMFREGIGAEKQESGQKTNNAEPTDATLIDRKNRKPEISHDVEKHFLALQKSVCGLRHTFVTDPHLRTLQSLPESWQAAFFQLKQSVDEIFFPEPESEDSEDDTQDGQNEQKR
eukprot:CAMPEP_0175123974 /NCGR_PEP_ID=MMETSP0087-20121206/2530_1 /TAXON_ID=136419 /ORGANISM="Unknown Unknown, Strain D1" /LENGTH=882 /DNA_ID=CAMNT_0016405703 /DNA_START=295 /DNA_END=2943 /DNA_ORIENTATION=-